jgi:hypothetical protein
VCLPRPSPSGGLPGDVRGKDGGQPPFDAMFGHAESPCELRWSEVYEVAAACVYWAAYFWFGCAPLPFSSIFPNCLPMAALVRPPWPLVRLMRPTRAVRLANTLSSTARRLFPHCLLLQSLRREPNNEDRNHIQEGPSGIYLCGLSGLHEQVGPHVNTGHLPKPLRFLRRPFRVHDYIRRLATTRGK